jgi:hypothetical protein
VQQLSYKLGELEWPIGYFFFSSGLIFVKDKPNYNLNNFKIINFTLTKTTIPYIGYFWHDYHFGGSV